jgi:hypothetical protein
MSAPLRELSGAGSSIEAERDRAAVPYGPGDLTTVWKTVRLLQP